MEADIDLVFAQKRAILVKSLGKNCLFGSVLSCHQLGIAIHRQIQIEHRLFFILRRKDNT